MASRAELLQICDELNIDRDNLSPEEMKDAIKEWADKYIDKPKYMKGETQFSLAFIKFITEEYDYVLEDRNKKEYSWKDLL